MDEAPAPLDGRAGRPGGGRRPGEANTRHRGPAPTAARADPHRRDQAGRPVGPAPRGAAEVPRGEPRAAQGAVARLIARMIEPLRKGEPYPGRRPPVLEQWREVPLAARLTVALVPSAIVLMLLALNP